MTKKATVACPQCGTDAVLDASNSARPFCSSRCRNVDFIGWANEEHSIPGNPTFDDVMSEELNSGE